MNVSCPHCKKTLGIPDNLPPNQRVACPHCKQQFMTPGPPKTTPSGGPSPGPTTPVMPPANPAPPSSPPKPAVPPPVAVQSPAPLPAPPAVSVPVPAAISPQPVVAPPSHSPRIEPLANPDNPAVPWPASLPDNGRAQPESPFVFPQDNHEARPKAHLAPPGGTWSLTVTAPLLHRILTGGFLVSAVLFFFPWVRVLIPAQLTPERPAVVLKNLALILDCSASMKERLASNDVKMQAVVKAVGELIDKLPADVRLTCAVTGNDRDSAGKAEIIRKLGPLHSDRDELKKKLAQIDAVGQSSLAEALKQAGEELAADKANGGIVLITDGPDISGGDPSAQAVTLAKRANFTYGLQVIGFGVPSQDLRTMRGYALAGKGRFHDTQSASELSEALDAVAQDARKSIEQDMLAGDLAAHSQTGLRIALGSSGLAMALLVLIYFVLILVGLCGSTALALTGTKTSSKLAFLERVRPHLNVGLGAISLLALLVLVTQLTLGFPVENQYRQLLFTTRTDWLSLAVLANLMTLAVAAFLWKETTRASRAA